MPTSGVTRRAAVAYRACAAISAAVTGQIHAIADTGRPVISDVDVMRTSRAGAIMSPIALGLMMGAGSSSKAVGRLGVSRVVAAGLSGRNGQPPSQPKIEQALNALVERVRTGRIEGLLALDTAGQVLEFL